ncbi:hypothetical protein F4860DRAFT_282608 [Xylaria cubensis]|nr:hypothetical protein F4860DRAFT_282608 [Xylaria cubensis]
MGAFFLLLKLNVSILVASSTITTAQVRRRFALCGLLSLGRGLWCAPRTFSQLVWRQSKIRILWLLNRLVWYMGGSSMCLNAIVPIILGLDRRASCNRLLGAFVGATVQHGTIGLFGVEMTGCLVTLQQLQELCS